MVSLHNRLLHGPMRSFALVWLLALLVLSSQPVPGAAAREPAGALEQGLHYYRAGDTDRAVPLLLDYLADRPDPAGEAQAALLLARIYHQRGRYDFALHYLRRIPESGRSAETSLLEGSALVRLGRSGEGMPLLLGLQEETLSTIQQEQRLAALAEGHFAEQRWLQALYFVHTYLDRPADPLQASELLNRAEEVIRHRLSAAQLAETAFMFAGSPVGQAAGLHQALQSLEAGDEGRARQLIEQILSRPQDFPGRSEAVRLREQLFGTAMERPVLGVILPLSGRFAAFGQAVQRGVELALEEFESEAFPVKLVFRDSGGDARRSAQAVSELANVEGLLAILGPLTGVAAEAAAARAQLERLPLLTLSQRDGLAETGSYVFRNSLTSALQARTLARYAVEERGLRTFAVLAPDNRLGEDMSKRFRDEIESRGGELVAVRRYAPQATDFRRQILLLKGKNPDAPQQTAEDEDGEPEKLPFEALFIPDYAEKIALIAPQLTFYGVRDVALLGINGWNDPHLLETAGSHVEGAVFTDGFHPYSSYPFVQAFVNRYFERYGEEPTILEAQGYDAAGILLSQLRMGGALNRDGLREALSRLQNYPGVAGSTSFDDRGDARKELFLLQVQRGAIVQIN